MIFVLLLLRIVVVVFMLLFLMSVLLICLSRFDDRLCFFSWVSMDENCFVFVVLFVIFDMIVLIVIWELDVFVGWVMFVDDRILDLMLLVSWEVLFLRFFSFDDVLLSFELIFFRVVVILMWLFEMLFISFSSWFLVVFEVVVWILLWVLWVVLWVDLLMVLFLVIFGMLMVSVFSICMNFLLYFCMVVVCIMNLLLDS